MNYTIEHIQEERKPFGPYRYKILKNCKEIAVFWHDYRGDSMGITITATGVEEEPPFGRCSDFLTGGGPDPIGLSEKAKNYLDFLITEEFYE